MARPAARDAPGRRAARAARRAADRRARRALGAGAAAGHRRDASEPVRRAVDDRARLPGARLALGPAPAVAARPGPACHHRPDAVLDRPGPPLRADRAVAARAEPPLRLALLRPRQRARVDAPAAPPVRARRVALAPRRRQ